MTARKLLPYLVTAVVTAVLLVPALKLGDADANVPFAYKEDGVFVATVVKTVVEQGWFNHNDRLGFPNGLEMYDFPLGGSTLDFLIMKGVAVFTDDFAVVENTYYLLTYVLIAIVAMLVLRSIGISTLVAGVVSILYAFAPYHLYRGETHLSLSAYHTVPLACWLALLLLRGDSLFFSDDAGGTSRTFDRRKSGLVAGACLLLAAGGSGYYAAFTLILLVFAAGVSYLWRRDSRVLLSGLEAAGLILVITSVCVAPSILYRFDHGPNPEVGVRGAAESENFGLKISQMVLPVEGHRVKPLADVRARYDTFPPRTKYEVATLGTVATLGFLWLLVVVIGALAWPRSRRTDHERHFATATLGLVLLGTVGGGATFVALFVTTQIRGWNRLSIFISFFALAAVGVLLDRARARLSAASRGWIAALAIALVVLGVADQASPALVPDYAANRTEYRNDHRFVASIERALPRGAAIFQLPYVPFPEPPTINGVDTNYDHLRGYLHSRHLRWSAAAMRGRPGDWSAAHATKPVAVVIPAVAAAGFSGVWLDRRVYGPAANTVQESVEAVAGLRAITSRDGRFSFVDLRPLAAAQRAALSPERRATLRDATFHPIRVTYADGFGAIESDLSDTWRWALGRARLELHNPKRTAQPSVVTIPVAAGQAGEYHLDVTPPSGAPERHTIVQERTTVQIRVVAPPGTSSILLSTDVPQLPLVPSQVVNTGRMRIFPVDVTTDAMAQALAGS